MTSSGSLIGWKSGVRLPVSLSKSKMAARREREVGEEEGGRRGRGSQEGEGGG